MEGGCVSNQYRWADMVWAWTETGARNSKALIAFSQALFLLELLKMKRKKKRIEAKRFTKSHRKI